MPYLIFGNVTNLTFYFAELQLSEINSGERNPNARFSINDIKTMKRMLINGETYNHVAEIFMTSPGYVYSIGKKTQVESY